MSNLEKGKFGKKYNLKTTKFKGGALKTIRDYPFMVAQTLQMFGIKNDQDQQIIMKHIKNLVKNNKKSKNKKSDSSDDHSDDSNSNSNSGSGGSDSDDVDVWK